jgi:hypothetical protein
MKKLFTVAIALLLIVMSCITVTAQTPTAISNEAQLKAMSSNKSYYLEKDITLSNNFTPISNFSGNFDGRGKKIINLKVAVDAGQNDVVYAGLFTKIDGGKVENLTLENVKINVTGGNTVYAGAVCGKIMIGGSVSNCRVSGEIVVNSSSASASVGGIAGQNENKISLCENIAKITVTALRAVVGGIVGDQARSDLILEKCQNLGQISASATADTNYAGGIAGKAVSDIKNCANYGSISLTASGEGWVGGIAARNTNGEITTCFSAGTLKCDAKTIGYVDPIVAEHGNRFSNNFYLEKISTAAVSTASALSSSAAATKAAFKGFDFYNIWKITSNGPILSCITTAMTQNKVENDTSTPSSSGSSDVTTSGSGTTSSGSGTTSSGSGTTSNDTGTTSGSGTTSNGSDTTSNGSGITNGSNTSGDSSDVSQTVTSGDGTTTSTSSNGGATTGTPSGEENGKFPVWIIIVLVAVVLLAGAAVVVVRNKKNSSED